MGLWVVGDVFKKNKKFPTWKKPFTIMIPVKNENPNRFRWVLESIIFADGEKQILIGDNGSTSQNLIAYKKLCRDLNRDGLDIRLFRMKKSGKKNTQSILHTFARYDIIVNVDSDVIVQKDTFLKLLAPFDDSKVGIANGRMMVFYSKTKTNKCYTALYDTANQIGRRTLGWFGEMACASGELLAYRKVIFDRHLNEYKNAKYLWDIPITFGEDRLMTNIILREGYKSVYCEDSIGRTWDRETLSGYIKQQLRWRRSWVRESIRCLSFSYKRPILFVHTILGLILPIIFSIVVFGLLLISYINFGLILVGIVLLSLTIISIVTTYLRDLPIIFEEPGLIIKLPFFAIFNLLFVTPLWIYAVITVDATTWGSR